MNMTEKDLLDELKRELQVPAMEANEITARMLAEKMNISYRMAYDILMKKVEEGSFKRRFVRGDHQRILAFSKVEK